MKRTPVPVSRPAITSIIVALIAAQALFVAGYVGHERTIYFWDHAMYFGMARQAYAVFSQSFANGWAMFRASLADSYNLLFTLPSLISFSLFGVSRRVFILTNFFAFFLVYEFAVAFLLRRALGFAWTTALIASLAASFLTPPLWLPLLEGYPDSGAAACIVFAAALGWSGARSSGIFRRALGIGVVLGLAVLLRRHFVYAAIALLATLGSLDIWEIGRAPGNRGPKIKRAGIYFLLCGFGFIATLAVVAPGFLQAALTTNYGALYLSYQRPAFVFLRFVTGGFGIGLLLVAASGLALLARLSENGRRLAVFTALYVLLWLAVWCLGPDQMGHHYILQALPLFVAVGLAGWFVWLTQKPDAKKYLIGGALVLGLAANSIWALWLSPTGVWPNDNGAPGLLSAARPPVIRPDYNELHRLAEYLQRTTKYDDRIMMVGSSFVFNLDLLYQIYTDMPGAANMAARFPKNPEIDHEEPAPFDAFAGSNIYLVPEPAQYHLDPGGQRVITAAANQFPPPSARANMFHADDAVFRLADGVVVKIWRRDAWTPSALHDVLKDIRRDGPQDANFSQDWATVALPLRVQQFTNAQGVSATAALFDPEHRNMDLFFDRSLEKGEQHIAFLYAGNCADPRFHFSILSGAGHTDVSKDLEPILPGQVFSTFNAEEGDFLQLDLSTAAAAMCRLDLQQLRVEKMP